MQVRGHLAAVPVSASGRQHVVRHRLSAADRCGHPHLHQPLRQLLHVHAGPRLGHGGEVFNSNDSPNLLYVGQSIPFDSDGIELVIVDNVRIQLPGAGPLNLVQYFSLYNASGVVEEGDVGGVSTRIDSLAVAFLSTLPGFRNVTIGASNLNALAPNYQTCTAPITFTNGLRPPVEPTASSSSLRFIYSYFISDGATYSVNASLLITASSAFASSFDLLGNPYQTVVGIAGTRVYTYLPTGARVVSNITGSMPASYINDQLFYPYALLAASPGVYTINTAPFLDSVGLAYSYDPAGPALGHSRARAPTTSTRPTCSWPPRPPLRCCRRTICRRATTATRTVTRPAQPSWRSSSRASACSLSKPSW